MTQEVHYCDQCGDVMQGKFDPHVAALCLHCQQNGQKMSLTSSVAAAAKAAPVPPSIPTLRTEQIDDQTAAAFEEAPGELSLDDVFEQEGLDLFSPDSVAVRKGEKPKPAAKEGSAATRLRFADTNAAGGGSQAKSKSEPTKLKLQTAMDAAMGNDSPEAFASMRTTEIPMDSPLEKQAAAAMAQPPSQAKPKPAAKAVPKPAQTMAENASPLAGTQMTTTPPAAAAPAPAAAPAATATLAPPTQAPPPQAAAPAAPPQAAASGPELTPEGKWKLKCVHCQGRLAVPPVKRASKLRCPRCSGEQAIHPSGKLMELKGKAKAQQQGNATVANLDDSPRAAAQQAVMARQAAQPAPVQAPAPAAPPQGSPAQVAQELSQSLHGNPFPAAPSPFPPAPTGPAAVEGMPKESDRVASALLGTDEPQQQQMYTPRGQRDGVPAENAMMWLIMTSLPSFVGLYAVSELAGPAVQRTIWNFGENVKAALQALLG